MLSYVCMKDRILGHGDIIDFFDEVIAHGHLSHAYCFIGRSHVGKLTIAEEISAKLLHSTRERLYINPDIAKISRLRDEKTEKLKKDISVEQVRDTIQFFSQSPFVKDGYKILIVDEAELMSKAAANALLKTLEEPRGKRIIFLLTENDKALLPTISSRCQKIFFRTLPEKMLFEYARAKGENEVTARELAHYAHGLPGILTVWLSNREEFNQYKEELKRFGNLKGKALYEKIQALEDLFGDKTDHIAARDHLIDIIEIWHANLLETYHDASSYELIELHERLLKTKSLLRQNVHPRLLMDHIMLQLP